MSHRAPSARFRERLLDVFAPIAAREGWSDAALKTAAAEAGLSEGEMALACPNGALDLADAFAARADEAMLARLAQINLQSMRYRERVQAAVTARIEAQARHKEAARAMTRYLTRPTRAGDASRLLWRALGDTSTDGNFYSKRIILSAVLASTYARWFSDPSDDHSETFAFLEARIENVMQFEKFKARLKSVGEAAETAVRMAARFRYGD